MTQKGTKNLIIPITSSNTALKELLMGLNIPISLNSGLTVIILKRDKKTYRITREYLLNSNKQKVFLKDGDQIEIKSLDYKKGQVFALSGAGNASIIQIEPSFRPTLADVLFVPNGALSNIMAKRSEVYLLRGKKSFNCFSPGCTKCFPEF